MIYMDNAATTAVCNKAKEAMLPYLNKNYGNPSGAYEFAAESREAIEGVRETLARCIGAEADEIYFTSGGTEADNWALTSIMLGENNYGYTPHLITSTIEHHAILNTCKHLEKCGVRVTYLPVDEKGMISLRDLQNCICEETALISIMFANNEIGTIEPIREIGKIARANNVLFHTDAVQAFGHMPINVEHMNIDLLSVSGHKCGAPKGTGFLYVNKKFDIEPFIYGGSQEKGKRSGTENVPGIVGFGAAAEYYHMYMRRRADKEKSLRNYLIKRVRREIPFSRLNGHESSRLPGNTNFSFQFIDGASTVVLLDMKGICVSAGAACSTGSGETSHVLKAIGLPDEVAFGTIRITLSAENTKSEVDFVVKELKAIIADLRSKSEEYNQMVGN